MTPIVVYDANVLFPAPLRDLLVGMAQAGLVRARWTEQILDECFRNILAQRPDLDEERLRRTRELMNLAIRDVLVTGHERLISGLVLPDPNDRHVLAAAVRAEARIIVTCNRRDFPDTTLAPLGIAVKHPDEFVLDVLDAAPSAVAAVVVAQARRLKNPPMSPSELVDVLARRGLVRSAARLREVVAMTG